MGSVQRVREVGEAEAGVAVAQLLVRDERRHGVHPRAPELLLHADASKAPGGD